VKSSCGGGGDAGDSSDGSDADELSRYLPGAGGPAVEGTEEDSMEGEYPLAIDSDSRGFLDLELIENN